MIPLDEKLNLESKILVSGIAKKLNGKLVVTDIRRLVSLLELEPNKNNSKKYKRKIVAGFRVFGLNRHEFPPCSYGVDINDKYCIRPPGAQFTMPLSEAFKIEEDYLTRWTIDLPIKCPNIWTGYLTKGVFFRSEA